jgi:hypothetical protein
VEVVDVVGVVGGDSVVLTVVAVELQCSGGNLVVVHRVVGTVGAVIGVSVVGVGPVGAAADVLDVGLPPTFFAGGAFAAASHKAGLCGTTIASFVGGASNDAMHRGARTASVARSAACAFATVFFPFVFAGAGTEFGGGDAISESK